MGWYIDEIDNNEFVKLVQELEAKEYFYEKVKYLFKITGIQNLFPGRSNVRTINGINYVLGIEIENIYHANIVMNRVCQHHIVAYYNTLSKPFMEKVDRLGLGSFTLKQAAETELEDIKEKLQSANELFKLGYKSEKKSDIDIDFKGIELSNDACWEVSIGGAYGRFEIILKQAIKSMDELDKVAQALIQSRAKWDYDAEEPALKLDTQYEVLLYFKYSGLLDVIKKSVKSDVNVSKVISQLTGCPAASLRTHLSTIASGYNNKTHGSNLFKKDYISNALNTLRDSGFDTQELEKVYEQVLMKESL